MQSNLVEIVGIVAGVMTGGYALLKFSIAARQKEREETFKLFETMHGQSAAQFKTMQEQTITLYGRKNGQIERISKEFVGAVKESNKATMESNKQTEITREKLTQAIQSNTNAIDELRAVVYNNTGVIANNTRTTEKALTVAEEIKK